MLFLSQNSKNVNYFEARSLEVPKLRFKSKTGQHTGVHNDELHKSTQMSNPSPTRLVKIAGPSIKPGQLLSAPHDPLLHGMLKAYPYILSSPEPDLSCRQPPFALGKRLTGASWLEQSIPTTHPSRRPTAIRGRDLLPNHGPFTTRTTCRSV